MIITGNIYCLPSNDEGGNRALKRSLEQMDKDRLEYEKRYSKDRGRLPTRKCRGCDERFLLETMWWHVQVRNSWNQKLYYCEECKKKKPDKNWMNTSNYYELE